MNTQENNKMIAEFMELPTEIFQPRGIINYGIDDSWYEEHELSFHLSWHWLMPVVKKCFQTGDDTHEWDNIMDTLFTCDREIVYAQVVEFINQYNNNESAD